MFFKHSYCDVFFRDNKIMKNGSGGRKKIFLTEDLKINLRRFAECQFL